MQKVLRKILEILDGTPSVYGKQQHGQSMVELALVTPLLIILIAGLAEIGYFAQNYLSLLEVSRVGARTATVQQGETDPLRWNADGLMIPTTVDEVAIYRNCNPGDERAYIGFYNFLACVMIRSIDPLPFRDPIAAIISPDDAPPPNGIDDIVISSFAVQTIIPSSLNAADRAQIDWPLNDASLVGFGNTPSGDIPQVVVVGRYPPEQNECTEAGFAGRDNRDPFDYIQDGDLSTDGDFILELPKLTSQGTIIDPPEFRGYDTAEESYRGFVWNGQHQIRNSTSCFGSEWSTKDVERLINLQGFDLEDGSAHWDGELRTYVPSQGIVLVEVFWQHETLSQYLGLAPVLSPVYAILGEQTVISVWSAFPLPQIEPRIQYPY